MNKNNNKKHGGLIVSIVLIVLALIFFNPGLFTKILPESITRPWNQLVWDLFVKDRESAITGGKILACVMTVIYSVGLALLLKVILNAIHFKQQRAETHLLFQKRIHDLTSFSSLRKTSSSVSPDLP